MPFAHTECNSLEASDISLMSEGKDADPPQAVSPDWSRSAAADGEKREVAEARVLDALRKII